VRLARGLIVVLLLAAALAAAGAAFTAGPPRGEDGTLTVRDGRGELVVRVKGSIIGHLGKGTLTVTESPDQRATVVVRGAERMRHASATTTVFGGTNIRFRVADNRRVVVRLNGKRVNFSAVGRGDGWMDGLGDPAAGIFFDGSYSLNGQPYHSLPDVRTRFELVLPGPGSSAAQRG
jgi:hypothetical protein